MPVTEHPTTPCGSGTRFEVRHSDTLGPRRRWTLFGALAAGSLAMAFVFAAGGVWPVLPFSVLELACLATAFAWLDRRAREWEAVTLEGERVVVERRTAGRLERHVFPRAWLRVEFDADDAGREPVLALRSGRESLRLGEKLPVTERVALARTLKGRLPAR